MWCEYLNDVGKIPISKYAPKSVTSPHLLLVFVFVGCGQDDPSATGGGPSKTLFKGGRLLDRSWLDRKAWRAQAETDLC